MDIREVSIIHHLGIVLLFIWLLSSFNYCHPLAYVFSFIYLYMVHDRYAMRFRKKVRFEERKNANQKRVLSDSESVRWLNHTIEKIWPVCMEEIVSQKILLPIVPWFLQKYKPWTVKEAVVQNMYLGRTPPMFTQMSVCSQSTDDDHLVLELGMNFRTADDMKAILAVKLTRRLGFGMWTKLHLTGMHVEGKVLVGVKFLQKWPFLGRIRVCFVEPPYFQFTVKPIIAHGLNVTELPGIAGWLDKLLTLAFEETLVEPNMLVVDVEKFVSPQSETWFSVDAKDPLAYALVEVIEASDIKPSDLNGLADPYVKGQHGAYTFKTNTQRKTLAPKWQEEFKIPISTWESPNTLSLEVCDKDRFRDDDLGCCSIKMDDYRTGQRHDIWLPLQNIKMGRLHLAIRVMEIDNKVNEEPRDVEESSVETGSAEEGEKLPQMADKFEPIDVEGQPKNGVWIHRPGTQVPQVWEPRKAKNGVEKDNESTISEYDTIITNENHKDTKTSSRNAVNRGVRKSKVKGIVKTFLKSALSCKGSKNGIDKDLPVEPQVDHSPRFILGCNSLKSEDVPGLSDSNDVVVGSTGDVRVDDHLDMVVDGFAQERPYN